MIKQAHIESITSRIIKLMAISMVFLILFIIFLVRYEALPGLSVIESRYAEKSIVQLRQFLQNFQNDVLVYANDIGHWDQSYDFIRQPSEEFITENFSLEAFADANLALVIFVDMDFNLVWGDMRAYDSDAFIESVPDFFRNNDLYSEILTRAENQTGIMKIDNNYVAFAISDVLKTNGEGPVAGYVLVGRYLNSDEIIQLAEQMSLNAEVYDAAALLPDYLFDPVSLLTSRETVTFVENNEHMGAITTVKDVHQKPLFYLKTVISRDLTNIMQKQLWFAGLLMLIGGVLILVIIYLMVRKWVLVPLNVLSRHMHEVARTGEMKMLQAKGTGDEFDEVSNAINYMQNKICSLINYDVLTGLANRKHFMEQLELLVRSARRENSQHAILFIDLDGFKQVNDTYGHQGGDALLKTVGKRLKATIRESDCAARLGGDEFMVIITHLKQPDSIQIVCEKLIDAIRKPVEYESSTLNVTASIGVAIYPQNNENVDKLIEQADAAMYQAKQSGKNQWRQYLPASG